MEQTAEFLGTGGQAAELDAAPSGRVVGQDCHVDLHLRTVQPFVTQPGRPAVSG
jgi:hypothetical protein